MAEENDLNGWWRQLVEKEKLQIDVGSRHSEEILYCDEKVPCNEKDKCWQLVVKPDELHQHREINPDGGSLPRDLQVVRKTRKVLLHDEKGLCCETTSVVYVDSGPLVDLF